MSLVKPKLSSAPQVPTKGAHGHREGCLYFCFKSLDKEGYTPDLDRGTHRQGLRSWPHLARQEAW